jgi:VWFA-related protein
VLRAIQGLKITKKWWAVILVAVLAVPVWGQQDKKEDIPDAPSAAQPPQPFPNAAPAPKNEPPANAPDTEPPPFPEPASPEREVKTVPPGTPREDGTNSRDELFQIKVPVNFVLVPVTVKDAEGRLVNGLLPKDFAVYENGAKQKMTFFTSDPFPLSAAVIIDLGMPDSQVQKVNQTFSALEGAFSQFDEVSVYTYSGTVSRLTDFGAVNQRLSERLNELKTVSGANDGPPVLGGPLGPQGPTINGAPVDPRVPTVVSAPKVSHVINDAILAAAVDLSKRDRARRKIIFVISNGREYGSKASYSDVLKVLLTNEIMVYGIGVGGIPIPGYKSLEKLHIPKLGTDNILPKYASATGGELFTEGNRQDIEEAYARAFGDARNQYTLGYNASSKTGGFRDIEVRVDRPDCKDYGSPCVRTSAKAGYYPALPTR